MNVEWEQIMACYKALPMKGLVVWTVRLLQQKLCTEPWLIQDFAPWLSKQVSELVGD
jgi:hypothetical protein